MRPNRPAFAGICCALLVLLAGCGAGGTDKGGDGSDGDAPHAVPSVRRPGSVRVYNTYGAEQGKDDRRPEVLTASEFTSFTDLEWDAWTAESATATGGMTGTWCLPECGSKPYAVTLRLQSPDEIGGTRYYTRFVVDPDEAMPKAMWKRFADAEGISADDADDPGRLMLPPDGE